MATPDEQFNSIIAEFRTALGVLKGILIHIRTTILAPSIRVVILNNTIVALTATVEETLRDLFKEYLLILEENIANHLDLRPELQNSNFDCAIQILKVYKNNGGLSSVTSIISNIEKCLNGSAGYSLLKDQLVYNDANFKSSQVTDVARSVGIANLWYKVCDCEAIEDYTSESVVPARVTSLVSKWNELFDERNLVVHRVSQANGWGPDRIRQAIGLAQIVIYRISVCLCDDVKAILSL